MINEKDKILINSYIQGFKDELDGIEREVDPILQKAYDLGRLDAIIGDDVRSTDYQSTEQILDKIKQQ